MPKIKNYFKKIKLIECLKINIYNKKKENIFNELK